jgi:hypothetical protein
MGCALRVSEDAARMRVDRALGRLHERLARQGIRSSAAALGMAMTHHAVMAAPAGMVDAVTYVATATPLSSGDRLAEFIASYGRAEAGMGLAAAALLGCALFIAGTAAQARAEVEAVRLEQHRAVQTMEKQVQHRVKQGQSGEITGDFTSMVGRDEQTPAAIPVQRMAGGRRTEIAATHEPFYRSLNLHAAEIERFESLCAMGPANAAMWVFDHTAVPAAPAMTTDEAERQLKALLGEQGYARYEVFRQTVPARSAVMQMAGELYLTEPLLPAQAERLTELFTAASRASVAGGGIDWGEMNWDSLQQSADNLLTPAQSRALTALRHRVAYQTALQQRAGLTSEASQ